jgi:hypothetical protein
MTHHNIQETQIPTNINLTVSQKILLAKIVGSPDVGLPGKKVPLTSEKLIVAKGSLVKMGLISVDDSTGLFRITPQGLDIIRADGIIDTNDQLTSMGQDLAGGQYSANAFTTPQNAPINNQGAQPITTVTGMEQPPRIGEGVQLTFSQFLSKTA